jgi:hypothetical protein
LLDELGKTEEHGFAAVLPMRAASDRTPVTDLRSILEGNEWTELVETRDYAGWCREEAIERGRKAHLIV